MSTCLWLFLALAATAFAADSALVDRVGSTGFVQLPAESFRSLSARQQALAYWLSQAAIAIDPIIYDQNSIYGLRQKRLLEEILLHPQGVDPQALAKITAFTKLFWANRGNHNEMTAQKFLPEFTFEELQAAARAALRAGSFKGNPYGNQSIGGQADLDRELAALRASLFDPASSPPSPPRARATARTSCKPAPTISTTTSAWRICVDFHEPIR